MESSHSANLARLIRPLRRVRPRVPFFRLAAHRIPTLWTLYRGLLRESAGENTRFRVTMLFRRYQHLTSPASARMRLAQGHKWLEMFKNANAGDERLYALTRRYERMIGARREKERWKRVISDAFAWEEKLRKRPILTGSYLGPSHSNRPIARMKPQLERVTMMIHKRRVSRERRMAKDAMLREWRDDLRRERSFEQGLVGVERVYDDWESWSAPIHDLRRRLKETFDLDNARQQTPVSDELWQIMKQARRVKVANKTRERERERRGEVLRCTVKRKRKGPPAHVLARMSEEAKRMDKVVRGVGFGGYVGEVKRRMGFRDEILGERDSF